VDNGGPRQEDEDAVLAGLELDELELDEPEPDEPEPDELEPDALELVELDEPAPEVAGVEAGVEDEESDLPSEAAGSADFSALTFPARESLR
jgi:hypothetical protein